MLKLGITLMILMCLGSCYFDDDSPCKGYRDEYNELAKPAFLNDLDEWTFVLKDSTESVDTFYVDSFELVTFITKNGNCNEDCEAFLLKGFGSRITLDCMVLAKPSRSSYDDDEYFNLQLSLNNKTFIDIAADYPNSSTVKYRNDSGLLEVKNMPYTLKRIQ